MAVLRKPNHTYIYFKAISTLFLSLLYGVMKLGFISFPRLLHESQNCEPHFNLRLSINLTLWKKEGLPNSSFALTLYSPFFPPSLSPYLSHFLYPGNEPGSKWAIPSRSLWILVTNNSWTSHSFFISSLFSFITFFFLRSLSPLSQSSPSPLFFLLLLCQAFLTLQDNVMSKNQWPGGIKVYLRVFLRSIINKTKLLSWPSSPSPWIQDAFIQTPISESQGREGRRWRRGQVCPRPR